MKSSTVAIGDSGLASQYNNLREDARASSYLLAHEQSSPDLTLDVEDGNFRIGKTTISFAGGSSPSFTAPSVNPRIDLLVINSSGTLSRVAGAEAASPTVPTIPSDKIVIAEVFNRVGQTSIKDVDDATNGYIQKDARPFLKNDNFKLDQDGSTIYAADGGGSDTYVITLDPVPTAYTVGMVINFKANTANTGAATLNVNGLGAKTIEKNKDIELTDGDIKAGQLVSVIYDGTNFQMQSQVGIATAGGSPLLDSSPGIITLSSADSTTEKTIKSFSVAGGSLGTSNVIVMNFLFKKDEDVGSGNRSITIRFKYGSTTIASTIINVSAVDNIGNGYIEAKLLANASINSQKGSISILTIQEQTSADANRFDSKLEIGTSAEDSTGALNISLTAQSNLGLNSHVLNFIDSTIMLLK